MVDGPGDVTQLLREWTEGNCTVLEPLFDQVYPTLRQIAGSLFRGERTEHLLQPTAVVHELFLKLLQQRSLRFEDRQHFYSLTAHLMRRILVDHARAEGARKRDGGTKISLSDDLAWVGATSAEILDLDRVLDELSAIDAQKCKVLELRFFLGFTAEETAELVGLSKATVDRESRFARGWVRDRLRGQAGAASSAA